MSELLSLAAAGNNAPEAAGKRVSGVPEDARECAVASAVSMIVALPPAFPPAGGF
jgi:hypothetical protein